MNNDQPTSASSAMSSNWPPFVGAVQSTDAISEERLTLLQQIYQQKQTELLAQFQHAQTNLALQHLSYFQVLQQQQQQHMNVAQSASQPSATSAPDTPDDSDTQTSPTTKEMPGARNRRSFSGPGQTISQSTKERLKTMITSKMSRNRVESDSASSQATTSTARTSANSISNSGAGSWSSAADAPAFQAHHAHAPVVVTSPHFEPYYIPSTVHHGFHAPASPSDYQLRKVSSEPNLKMRIRAKLLNKCSSPIQSHSNAFNWSHPSHSDTPMETGNETDSQSLLPTATPHLMIPSPSLPNLTSPAQIPVDWSTLLAEAFCSQFVSMPSLLKNYVSSPLSMIEPPFAYDSGIFDGTSSTRPTAKFESRTLNSSLPFGGYPSLLKQQLRDLVLRRKSLVREEPEDETALEAQLVRLQNASSSSTPNKPLKTGVVYDSSMVRHQCVCGDDSNHVEHGGRVHAVWSRFHMRGLMEHVERVFARKAPLEMLRTVHSSTYVTFFAVSPTACLKLDPTQLPVKSFVQLPCGGIGVDTDTYFNDASTQLAARVAVGSLAELALQVAESRVRNGFACIRPPGHHAEYDQAMGFCFFNNVAITVKHLQQRCAEQCSRIAIIDWDVHHGNGTQLCFESDPSVLYLSLHRHDNGNFFPGTGAVTEIGVGLGEGFTVNIPFSGEMMDDADYLAAWRLIVLPVLNHFQPTFVIVSAGFDAVRGHSQALGGYNLSPQLFGYFTRQLMNYASGRVVLALEGGYDMNAIADAAEECIKVLCGDFVDTAGQLSDEALNSFPKQNAQDAIQKVIAVHKKHWPTLNGSQGIKTTELQWQTVTQQFACLSV